MDANVPIVANGGVKQAGLDCFAACLDALEAARERGLVVLDDEQHILTEYRRNLSPSGQPGAGDSFMKWVWDHQADPRHCERVRITPKPGSEEEFAEFPADPDLAGFDRADRKYVAVALVSPSRPRVLNAVDTDWWYYRDPLRKHGVEIEFLCPEQMKRRR